MSEYRRPCVIGLCGRSGSGKSFVSRIFESSGVPTVDTDAVYREMTSAPSDGVLSDCMKALVGEFGDVILSSDLSLDRKRLAEMVFSENGEVMRRRLNEITHAYILCETDRRVTAFGEAGAWAVIVDAPLLFESGYDKKCDFIVAASAPEATLIHRIIRRDGIGADAAARRLASQISDGDVRSRADFVIETDDTEEAVTEKVKDVVSSLKAMWEGKKE